MKVKQGLRRLLAAGAALTLLSAGGCANFWSTMSFTDGESSVGGPQVRKPDDFPVLRATGYAIVSRQPGPTRTDRTLQAMRASKIEAYRELSEQVSGLHLKSETHVTNNRMRGQDTISAQLEAFVHGARVIRQYPNGDTYATELELDTRVLYDLYEMRGTLRPF